MKYLLFGVHDFFFCFPYLFRKQTDQLTRSKSKCKPKRARIHHCLLSVNPLCIYIVNYCFRCVFSSLFNVPTCFFSWPWQMPHVIWTVWSAPTPMELIGLAILHFIVGWVLAGRDEGSRCRSMMETLRIVLLLLHEALALCPTSWGQYIIPEKMLFKINCFN